ncbi:MAG: hypothetical protein IPM91_16120 [Bacteroidetes bacterium]|nr:hypothetical protein [Bacteroidota bacterium]
MHKHFLHYLILTLLLICSISCNSTKSEKEKTTPHRLHRLCEDATLAQAKQGFFDALKESGFSEDSNTISILYRNAQGDQPTLLQAADYVIAQQPALIATNTTLATITTVQRNRDVPAL